MTESQKYGRRLLVVGAGQTGRALARSFAIAPRDLA